MIIFKNKIIPFVFYHENYKHKYIIATLFKEIHVVLLKVTIHRKNWFIYVYLIVVQIKKIRRFGRRGVEVRKRQSKIHRKIQQGIINLH